MRGSGIDSSGRNGREIYLFDPTNDERGYGHSQKHDFLPDPDDFDPTQTYSKIELDLFADAILWRDVQNGRRNFHDPVILFEEHELERRKREIYVWTGTPTETVLADFESPDGQRMYWRSHPRGRRMNSEEQKKKNRASWYR